MRIAVLGPIYSDSLAKCILYTLKDMGHDVVSLNPEANLLSGHLPDALYTKTFLNIKPLELFLLKAIPSLETYYYKNILVDLSKLEPDLIISTMWDIPAPVVEKLKKRPGSEPILVVWCPDALSNFDRQYIFDAPWDFLFFKDRYIVTFMRNKLGLNAHLLPLGCYPRWHRRVELSERERPIYECDITTAGALYYYRAKIFENFKEYNIKIWGPPPKPYMQSPLKQVWQGRYVGETDKAKAFNGAAIVLNTMHYAEIYGLNQRVFDANGCGGFQIVDDSPVIGDYFVPGKEIVVFGTLKELKEIIPYYLNRPEEREGIALSGYERAHKEHTFRHRLDAMFSIISEQNRNFQALQSSGS
jgi:spore maturation protein CgeB